MNVTRTLLVGAIACAPLLASAAPEITGGARVTIINNKATNVVAVGGSAETGRVAGGLIKAGEASLNGVANVNSLVMNSGDAKVSGQVFIANNHATDIFALGGLANVNSVVMGK